MTRKAAGLLGAVVLGSSCVSLLGDIEVTGAGAASSSSNTGSSSASATTVSSSSSGTPMLCSPGETMPCYTGPNGTEDAGACHGGMETCASDGGSWGACEGEVLPQPRTCANMPGVSCDGVDCVLWSIGLAGGGVTAIAATPDNGVVIAGTAASAMVFGQTTLPSGPFTAKVSSQGTVLWAIPVVAYVLAIDGTGNVLGAGNALATTQIGTTTIPVSQYVFKLTPAGAVTWAVSIAGLGSNPNPEVGGAATSIAAAPNGDVLLAGVFADTSINLGDGAVPLVNGSATAYVARLNGQNGSGTMSTSGPYWTMTWAAYKPGYVWIGPFVGVSANDVTSVAYNAAVAPTLGGSQVMLGQIGLVKLGPSGAVTGVSAYGENNKQTLLGASVAADGTAALTGSFSGTINPGNGAPPLVAIETFVDGGIVYKGDILGNGFLLAIEPSNGTVRLALGFGTDGHATGAALGPDGSLTLGGTFTGTASIGGSMLDAAQGTAVLIARFKPDGSLSWARAFPHPLDKFLLPSLVVTPDNATWLAGNTSIWPLNFGLGSVNTMTTPGTAFLARFAP